MFKRKTVEFENRRKLVRKRALYDNCLFQGHIARACPKESFCKVSGCQVKHSTFLHSKPVCHNKEKPPSNEASEESRGEKIGENQNPGERNGYVNDSNSRHNDTGAGVPSTGLAIVPVKVKCKDSAETILTYAFFDTGTNTSCRTNELLERLGTTGKKTLLSLTTIQNENRPTECRVVSLEVFDLDENNFVELPRVFSTGKLPVDESSIPRQADVDRWSHLKDVKIDKIDAPIGILIGNDAPRALEPKEVKECQGRGPYAVRTIFGWTINGPLGRSGRSIHANFIRADHALSKQFERFCNAEFNDSAFDSKLIEMSQEDSKAASIMESTIRLHDGHYETALPWRNFPPRLPNDRPLAEHRLMLLKKKLLKNPGLLSKYADFMDNLLDKKLRSKGSDRTISMVLVLAWYNPMD